jgi:hypothetical protein
MPLATACTATATRDSRRRREHAPEPQRQPNGKGTSLHDASGWFPSREFVIPTGTNYSDEILIVKDKHKKQRPSKASTTC